MQKDEHSSKVLKMITYKAMMQNKSAHFYLGRGV